MKHKNIILSLLLLFIINSTYSQVAVGEWEDHFSYRKAHAIAESDSKIYVATELAIFIYDKEDYTTEKLSKVNGLSDSGIRTINYNEETKSLFIAYENSNIDIIKDNTITNFPTIKKKQFSGNKKINRINFVGATAWLSCGFGIILFDTNKLEFIDTYYIGDNAEYLNVRDIAFLDNYVFATSEKGIYKANMSSNLRDYNNWNRITDIPQFDASFSEIISFNNKIYAYQNDATSGELYCYKNNSWSLLNTDLHKVNSISKTNNLLVFSENNKVVILDDFDNVIQKIRKYNIQDSLYFAYPNDAFFGKTGELIIADNSAGLVMKKRDGTFESYYPNGPLNNETGRVTYYNKKVYVTNGNYSSIGARLNRIPTVNIYENNTWTNFIYDESLVVDFHSIYIDRNSENIFIGAWGTGVFEFENKKLINKYDITNSTLETSIAGNYVRIPALIKDEKDNLWVSNYSVTHPISVLTSENEWYSFNFKGAIEDQTIKDIIVTENGNKWAEIYKSGICVFNENETFNNENDDQYKVFYPKTNISEEESHGVNAIAEDKDGNIWVGTTEGIFVYYNPEDVFNDEEFLADRIQITVVASDTSQQYLLKTSNITCILVDDANRKWIGTQNSGLFLVSETGKDEIHAFNTTNSPLHSNTILDIAMEENSGELFILTDNGVLGYRSNATKGNENFSEAYVFPNPVRPDYNGVISITGLVENVDVKITDISGNLVYTTKANGGQAEWNGKTMSGRRVNSGVYLIFCTNEDGEKTFVTKLLFIN